MKPVKEKEERTVWIIAFLLVFAIMICYLVSVSYGVCRPLFYPRAAKREKYAMPPGGKVFECVTSDGCKLKVRVFYTARRQGRAVILVPDGGRPGTSLYRQAEWFLHRGYDAVLADQRGCGRKERRPVTLGYREHRDLRLIFTLARRILGEECRIGTYGVGVGAVTALLHACLDERVDFVVADSPWSDLRERMRRILIEDLQMPPYPVLWVIEWMSRILAGVPVKEVSPLGAIRRRGGLVATPVMFIASETDRGKEMVRELYEAKQGEKVFYLCPNTEETKDHSIQYGFQMEAFLRETAEDKRAVV